MAGLHDPLPTLRQYPHGDRRTARGRCGSLFLHRSGLSPPTSCQSPGALPRFLLLSSRTPSPLSRSPSSQSSCGFSLKVIWNLSIWGAYNNNDALLGGCAISLPKSARNSDEQLFALLDEIVGRGDEPSVRTLHKAAGGGSYARLRKVFELWEKDHASSSAATGKDRRQEKRVPSTAAADQIDDGTAAEQDTGADSISDVASPGDQVDIGRADVLRGC